MLDLKTLELIKMHLQKGTDPAAIKDVLLEKGFTQQDIDQAFQAVTPKSLPSTPIKKPQESIAQSSPSSHLAKQKVPMNAKYKDVLVIAGLFFLLLIILGINAFLQRNQHVSNAQPRSVVKSQKTVAVNTKITPYITHEKMSMMVSPTATKLQTVQERPLSTEAVDSKVLNNLDPAIYLTTWNFNNLSATERSKYYKEQTIEKGKLLREYWLYAKEKDITVAKGTSFPAWTYNDQVPGPTIRATEGDNIVIHFTNQGKHSHAIHFFGYYSTDTDGSSEKEYVQPGESATYSFTASPFGLHVYRSYAAPMQESMSRGMYGVYIVDPKKDTRPKPEKEFVMTMNAFDTRMDGINTVYSMNSVAFYYKNNPIQVKTGDLVRLYLVNATGFDSLNTFHLHGNFFDEYKTGTKLTPDNFTDITSLSQGERSILDVKFKNPGLWMFSSETTDFAEKGLLGFFNVLSQ